MVEVRRIGPMAGRFLRLVRRGQLRPAVKSAGRLAWSTSREYGMRRDLSLPFDPEPARIEIRVRPAEPRDLDLLFAPSAGDSRTQLWRQERLVVANIPTCWVAVDPDEIPCFMAWLIRPQQNQLMKSEIGPGFSLLAPDEVLMESGFTPQRYRGLRIGPDAISRILQNAGPDARWAWAYTGIDNRRAQLSLSRAGFAPAAIFRSSWRLLRHTTHVEALPPESVIPLG